MAVLVLLGTPFLGVRFGTPDDRVLPQSSPARQAAEFLLSGGVLVPLKALVLNLLSLTATFGAMVWIFQDGNLSGLLGFTATGTLDTSMPILMFCIAFGLSMDYEVFPLSRIKEEHDRRATTWSRWPSGWIAPDASSRRPLLC